MKNQIREYRKLRGFTMQQLADMVGVSLNAIYEYETNKYQPRVDVIDKLLLFLGCSFDQLFIRESFQQIDFDDFLDSPITCNYHPEDKLEAKQMLGRIMSGCYSDVL